MASVALSHRIFGLLSVVLGVGLAWPTAAYEGLSSLYLPTLTIAIDGVGADRSVVLHAQRDNPAAEELYLCSRGLCEFHHNQHADESAWTYSVEQFKSKAPNEALTDPAQLTTWYNNHRADPVVTFAVTDTLRQVSFKKIPRKRDYTLKLTSVDHGIELVTVDSGEYNPLPQEFSLSNLTVGVGSFKKHAVEIGTVGITLLIIYYGIKIVVI